MKKIISIFITIILVVLLNNLSYANDSEVSASLSSSTVQAGDTITLSINIAKTDDGIAGVQGKIAWDKSQLTYVSSQVGNVFSTLNFNDDSESEALGTFSAYGNEYITTGGTAFTVTFEVNPDLTEEIPINIDITKIKAEYQTAGTVDIQDKEVNLSINNGEFANKTNETVTNTNMITNTNTSAVTNVAVDNTIAKEKLPAAGVSIVSIFAILILLIILIVSGKNYIYYLKDTNKQLK